MIVRRDPLHRVVPFFRDRAVERVPHQLVDLPLDGLLATVQADLRQAGRRLNDGVADRADDSVHGAAGVSVLDVALVGPELLLERFLLVLKIGDDAVALGRGEVQGAVACVQAADGLVDQARQPRSPVATQGVVKVDARERFLEGRDFAGRSGDSMHRHRLVERRLRQVPNVAEDGVRIRLLLVDLVDEDGEANLLRQELAQLLDFAVPQGAVFGVDHHDEVGAEGQVALNGDVVRLDSRVEAGHVHEHLAAAVRQRRVVQMRLGVLRLRPRLLQRLLLDLPELLEVDFPQHGVVLPHQLHAFGLRRSGGVDLRGQSGLRHDVRGQAPARLPAQIGVHQRGLARIERPHQRNQHAKPLDLAPRIRCGCQQVGCEFNARTDLREPVQQA